MPTSRRPASRSPDVGSFALVVVAAGAPVRLRPLEALSRRVILHGFEPDRSSGLSVQSLEGCQAVHIECAALARAGGTALLNVTRDRRFSSLLEPDVDTCEEIFGRGTADPLWRRALEIVERRPVATTALDTWADRHALSALHFLALDAHGSELDVLYGAERLLARGAVDVLQMRVSLRPFYRGQAGFTAIDALLTSSGYELVDCRFTPEDVGWLRPDGPDPLGDGRRWATAADATYFRATLAVGAGDEGRAVAAALVLGTLGYGSTAATVLDRGARWRAEHVDAFLNQWARPSIAERRRQWLRHQLPPALLDTWARR